MKECKIKLTDKQQASFESKMEESYFDHQDKTGWPTDQPAGWLAIWNPRDDDNNNNNTQEQLRAKNKSLMKENDETNAL